MPTPTVVWTQGGNTLTWDTGIAPGGDWSFAHSVTVMRSAGNVDYTYDYNTGTRQTIPFTFPHVNAAKKTEFDTWRLTTVVGPKTSFLHTDNSKSPAFTKQVRLVSYTVTPEFNADPASPLYTVKGTLQEASS